MSGKLDQSLDEILSSTNRRSSVRGGAKGSAVTRRSRRTAKPTVAPPVGGVKKPQRGGKTGAKAIPTGPSGLSGESKILVSNLPKDVTEAMVKIEVELVAVLQMNMILWKVAWQAPFRTYCRHGQFVIPLYLFISSGRPKCVTASGTAGQAAAQHAYLFRDQKLQAVSQRGQLLWFPTTRHKHGIGASSSVSDFQISRFQPTPQNSIVYLDLRVRSSNIGFGKTWNFILRKRLNDLLTPAARSLSPVEYFVKSVGPVKKVEVSYGPGGVSRGIATIFFARPDSATKALETLSGVLVDGRSMKIDIILDARRAAAIPPPKGLGERITQPKAQPKSAAVTKGTTAARGKAARGRGGKTAKNARPAKKTAEELDSEMADYFGGANTEAAQPAANGTNGDAAMDDEILVSYIELGSMMQNVLTMTQ
ncbi:hypothetical protein HYFRA_00007848 [Hymenoscyphus fraxineus]|uniref:RRM domain-containing protein n=1 Tax=Hymenoscyphus fraxineus TaxID=746836 RepID=A0A9N9KKZ3_9HELO|nr:hypothetical protein HYFRA_00007848 [Hymenoscyphus fraxineus]